MPIAVSGSNIVFADGSSIASGFTGFKNRIINGAMVIDQRNAGASVTLDGNGVYPVDRWRCDEATDGVATGQQVSDAPVGFVNSLKFTTTTADSSLASGQYMAANHFIEGFNTADFNWGSVNAKTFTISFWVKSSLTGTFAGGVDNNSGNRSYVFNYTISSANTWEYKTVTIAGDTTGTWETNNSRGLGLRFGLGSGTTFEGTVGAWQSGSRFSSSGAVSVIGTLNATWQITGVQLEAGSSATSFEYRDYGNELRMCQRYFIQTEQYGQSTGGAPTITNYIGLSISAFNWTWDSVSFPVAMRTSATVTTSDFNGNIGKISIWTSSGGGTAFNINPYTLYATRNGFSYSDYNNAKFGVGIGGYIASAEL